LVNRVEMLQLPCPSIYICGVLSWGVVCPIYVRVNHDDAKPPPFRKILR
jgi:hypothetical protein